MGSIRELAEGKTRELIQGLACCWIGLCLARGLSQLHSFVLQLFITEDTFSGRFSTATVLPPDAPWVLHAFHEFGTLILIIILLPGATWLPVVYRSMLSNQKVHSRAWSRNAFWKTATTWTLMSVLS